MSTTSTTTSLDPPPPPAPAPPAGEVPAAPSGSALAAVAIAARDHGITVGRVLGILVAMAGARTAAMGFNRIVDRHIDARNPRTAGRELPTGAISVRAAWTLTVVASL